MKKFILVYSFISLILLTFPSSAQESFDIHYKEAVEYYNSKQYDQAIKQLDLAKNSLPVTKEQIKTANRLLDKCRMAVFFNQQIWSILVFVVCLIIQLFLYLKTRQAIRRCRTLFPKRGACTTQESETGTITVGVLSSEERSPEFKEIINETNDYLEKNQNNISLEALKDIATRISDNAFALSTSKISFPMYYGLMGTYAGVALGLFEFYSSTGGGTGMFDISTLYPFLGGVVVAMLTSLFGLAFTTNNNRNASAAEDVLEDGRDAYFSFLQKEVVPKTPSTIAQTLKSSVSELQETVKTLSTSLATAFEGITVAFGNSLREDLGSIQETVAELKASTQALEGSMRDQHQMITNMLRPEFATALDKISTTVRTCSTVETSINNANDKLQQTLELQRQSADVQAALATTQQSFADSQTAVNNAIQTLKEDIESFQRDLKERLEAEKTSAQNEFLSNLQNTRQMFADITSVLDRFKTFEKNANKFAEAEVGVNSGLLEKVDSQIRRIESVRTKIDEYIDNSSDIVETNLTENQIAIKEACDKFKRGWGDMFYQMSPENLVKPADFLSLLERMEYVIRSITTLIPPQTNHTEVISELAALKQGLSEANTSLSSKAEHDAIMTELRGIKTSVGQVSTAVKTGADSVKEGLRTRTTSHSSPRGSEEIPEKKRNLVQRILKLNK